VVKTLDNSAYAEYHREMKTIPELSEHYSIHRDTLRKAAIRQEFPARKSGERAYLIDDTTPAFQAWLVSRQRQAGPVKSEEPMEWKPGQRAAYLHKQGVKQYVPALVVAVQGKRVKIIFRARRTTRPRIGAVYYRELITPQERARLLPDATRFCLTEERRQQALRWYENAGIAASEDDLWLYAELEPEVEG
jgi:hypothetical protein